MGNIKIRSLPTVTQQSREYVFSDLKLDLTISYTRSNDAAAIKEKKDAELDYDLQAIRNSIQNIFLTSPGEKILNPQFGSDLRDFLFMPVNETTARMISDRIAFNIKVWEPRVRLVERPKVTFGEQGLDGTEYLVDFNVVVPSLDNSQLYFLGSLNSQGYVTFA